MTQAVMAVDQGTTSTRAILFDHHGLPLASEQMEHRQIFPAPGWVEHDPVEIWNNTRLVMGGALARADEWFGARFEARCDHDRRGVDLIEARLIMGEVLAEILSAE